MINLIGTALITISAAALILQWVFTLIEVSPRSTGRFLHTPFTARFLFQKPGNGKKSVFQRFIRMLQNPRAFLKKTGGHNDDGDQAYFNQAASGAALIHAGSLMGAFIVLVLAFLLMDLTNRTAALHASFDMEWPYRMTISLFTSIQGKLLFLASAVAAGKLAFIYSKKERRLSHPELLQFAIIESILLFPALLFASLQPFREFPMPLKMGEGLSAPALHWTQILESPFAILSVAFYFLYYTDRFARARPRPENPDRDSLLMSSLLFAVASAGLHLIWNFSTDPGGSLWKWSGPEIMLLAWILLLAGQFAGERVAPFIRNRSLTGNLISSIGLTLSFPVIWSLLLNREDPSESLEAGIFLSIIALLLLFLTLHQSFRRVGLAFLKEKPVGPPSVLAERMMMLLAYTIPVIAFALIAVAIPGLLPADCTTGRAGSELCSTGATPAGLLNQIAFPILLIVFTLGGWTILFQSRGELSRSSLIRILLGGLVPALALLIFARWILPPVVENRVAGGLLDVVFLSVVVFAIGTGITATWDGLKTRKGEQEDPIKQGGILVYTGVGLVLITMAASVASVDARKSFHYYLMLYNPAQDAVQYYSGDKAYISDFQVESGSLYIGPRVSESAYRSNRLKFNITYEGHYRITRGESPRIVEQIPPDMSPRAFENRMPALEDRLLHELAGVSPGGKVKSEIIHAPRVDPGEAQIIRGGPFGTALRDTSYRHDLTGFLSGDVYLQLEELTDPVSGRKPDLSHVYEFYYFDAEKGPQAYLNFFPHSIMATVRVKILALPRLAWIGVLLIVSALILFLYGELARRGLFRVSFESGMNANLNTKRESDQ